jgi:hypothetical protein
LERRKTDRSNLAGYRTQSTRKVGVILHMKLPFSSFKIGNYFNELYTKGRRNFQALSFTHDVSYYEIVVGCDAALELMKWTFSDLTDVCRGK